MRIGSHQVKVLHRFSGCCQVHGPAVTLMSIGQHTGVAEIIVITIVARIEITVVGTLQAFPAGINRLHIVVIQHHSIDILGVSKLTGQCHREDNRKLIVDSQ